MLIKSTQLARLCLTLILLAVPPQVAAEVESATVKTESAAVKLEAVKQALIDLALGTEVKLDSAAYLDSNGALHEASVMSTNTKVRGIRVLSYLQEAGITTARVDASILSDASCPGFRPGIRREATVRLVLDPANVSPNRPVGDHYYNELLALSEQTLLASLAGSRDWSVKSEVHYANAYQAFVQGSSADDVPYRFDIVLRDRNPADDLTSRKQRVLYHGARASRGAFNWVAKKLPTADKYEPWPAQSLAYELMLVDRATEQPLWSQTLPLDYPRVERGYGKDPLPVKFKRQVQAVTDQFISQVTEQMDCYAQAYQLTPISGDNKHMAMNAGFVAGIKVGDQFLLSDDANIMDRAVNPAGLDNLSLAQVVSVSAHSASLRQLAGPQRAQSDLRNLVAVHL